MKRASILMIGTILSACASTPSAPPAPAQPPAPPEQVEAFAPPPKQAEPDLQWWHSAVFYEVFVRSFYDSDGDGVGDLRGIIEKLDYLNDGDPSTNNDMGITALWLMPIFASPSYHGYDVVDYYAVDPEYGTEEDLRALLDACHQRGIKVVVDFMLNHTSVEHPWFIESQNAQSATRDWYIWRDDNPGWTQPWGNGPTWHRKNDEFFYGIFWEGMPDLDFTNPDVEAEFIKIGEHWLNLGIDGFRLDAIRHLVEDGSSAPDIAETHDILKRMRTSWKASHPDSLIIGEVWSGPQDTGVYWGDADELDLTYDFHISGGIVGAVSQGRATPLFNAINDDLTWLPVQRMSAPFVTNHDMDRIASILGGDTDRLKLAASALLTLPGTPFIYYGEEIGLKNTGVGGDEAKRAPMQWTVEGPTYGFTQAERAWSSPLGVGAKYSVASQEAQEASLLDHYRLSVNQRVASPALSAGTLHGANTLANGNALVFQRAIEGHIAVVILNFSETELGEQTIELDPAALTVAGFTSDTRLVSSPLTVTIEGSLSTAIERSVSMPSVAARGVSISLVNSSDEAAQPAP